MRAGPGDRLADDDATGHLADDEQPAAGLRVGEQHEVVVVDAGPDVEERAHPLQVAPGPPLTNPSRTASRAPSSSGTAATSSRAPTPEARSMVARWPSSPKPVTSVAACDPGRQRRARGLAR